MSNESTVKSYTLEEAIQKIRDFSSEYQKKLTDKIFAYAYTENNRIHIYEVKFKAENYLHLTGMDYKNLQYLKRKNGEGNTRAYDFWRLITDDSNTIEDIIKDVSFINDDSEAQRDKNRINAYKKIENLGRLVNITNKAKYLNESKKDGTFNLMINRERISLILKKIEDFYVPKSSINTGLNKQNDKYKPILAIYSKKLEQDKYSLIFINKDAQINESTSFDNNILSKFDQQSFIPSDEIKVNEKISKNIFNAYKNGINYNLSQQLHTKLDKLKTTVKYIESIQEIDMNIDVFIKEITSHNHNVDTVIELIDKHKFPGTPKMLRLKSEIINKLYKINKSPAFPI